MKIAPSPADTPVLAALNRRLTALWALSEAGLGGLLHAFRLPFSGILVGGFALLSVAMLAWHNHLRSAALIRAWIIVSAVKFGLSPHSPPTAYLAVSFQAFFSLLCFRVIPHFRTACVVSAAVCTLESALQRLIVLTLLFGVGLWKAVDEYTEKLLEQLGVQSDWSGSNWLIGAYLLAHLVAGLLIGWWAGKLPALIENLPQEALTLMANPGPIEETQGKTPQKHRFLRKLATPLVFLLAGGILWYLHAPLAGLLLRGGALWLAWLLLFQAPVQRVILGFVRRISGKYTGEIEAITAELPDLRSGVKAAWQLSATHKGWRRLTRFSILFFAFGLGGAETRKER